MSPTAFQEHALIPLKYSKLEKLEKPLEFDVGLSSNSLHASEFMAVGENLIGQRYVSWVCLLFSGFLDRYNSPMKCQWSYFNIEQNRYKKMTKHSHLNEHINRSPIDFIKCLWLSLLQLK